jgi:hypothetical protein
MAATTSATELKKNSPYLIALHGTEHEPQHGCDGLNICPPMRAVLELRLLRESTRTAGRVRPVDLPDADGSAESVQGSTIHLSDRHAREARLLGVGEATFAIEEARGPGEFLTVDRESRR